jgi:hypothetical protein
VGLPVKGAGDEDTEVSHLVLGLHLRVTNEGVCVGSEKGGRPDEVRRGTRWTEEHEFRLVRISAEAVVSKPVQDVMETGDSRVEAGPNHGAGGEDGTVVNVEADCLVMPSGVQTAEHDGGVDSGEDG